MHIPIFLTLSQYLTLSKQLAGERKKKNITVVLQNETTDVNVRFSACNGCKFSLCEKNSELLGASHAQSSLMPFYVVYPTALYLTEHLE